MRTRACELHQRIQVSSGYHLISSNIITSAENQVYLQIVHVCWVGRRGEERWREAKKHQR